MKKFFVVCISVMTMISLVACTSSNDESDVILEVLNSITVVSEVSDNFTLTVAKDNVSIVWSSDNDGIEINGANANVTQIDEDVNVTLTATASKNDITKIKYFSVKVLKKIVVDEEGGNVDDNVSPDIKNLFISEYYKGVSNNKYIEIYNPNNIEVDLSTYQLVQANNANTFQTVDNSYKLALSGMLEANGTLVVYHFNTVDSIVNIIKENASLSISSSSSAMGFNGDDAIGLFNEDELVDIFGIDDGLRNNFEVDGLSVNLVAIRKPNTNASNLWDSNEFSGIEVVTSNNLSSDDAGKHTYTYESVAHEVAAGLIVPTVVSENFELVNNVDTTSISWSSSNTYSISIDGVNAIVTKSDVFVDVILTAIVTDIDKNTFTIEFIVSVEALDVTTILQVLNAEIGTHVKLSNITVIAKGSSGVFITDGIDTIFCYGNTDVVVGNVYNVSGTTGSYYNSIQISNTAVFTLVEDGVSSSVSPKNSTIEELTSVDLNNGYFRVNATINIDDTTIRLESNGFSVVVGSTLENSTSVLEAYDGLTLDINVFLSNTNSSGTIRYVIFTGSEDDFILTDLQKAQLAANELHLEHVVIEDLHLPLTGLYDSIIRWESSNTEVITDLGIITRGSENIEVTMKAFVTVGEQTYSIEIHVTVLTSDVVEIPFTELFISEYYKGASSNKYIEIYNPNDYEVDLGTYKLVQANNASTFDTVGSTYHITLSGILEANGTFVIYNASTDVSIISIITTNASLYLSTTSNTMTFTGDDAIGLFNNNELVDIFGVDDGLRNNFVVDDITSGTLVATRNIGFSGSTSWDESNWSGRIADLSTADDAGKHTYTYESVAHEVALALSVDYILTSNFVLPTTLNGCIIMWYSSNEAVTIDSDGNVVVTTSSLSHEGSITAVVTDEDENTYTISFKTLVESTGVTSIEGALQEVDGTKVNLSNVTVIAKGSSGVFITDGKSSIYCYGNTNVEVGSVYDVIGFNASYNNVKQLANTAVFTKVEDGQISSINPIESTVESLTSVDLNNGYYTITATVVVSGSIITLVSDNFSVQVHNSESSSTDVLKQVEGYTLDINVFLINTSNASGSVRYVVFAGEESDLIISDKVKVETDAAQLSVNEFVTESFDLVLVGTHDTTITWISNNVAIVIEGETAIVTRGSEDVIGTLVATISLNDESMDVTFAITVKMQSDAEELFITFDLSSLSGSGDLSASKLSGLFDGENFSVTSVSKIYEGSGSGVRLGTSSAIGTYTINNNNGLNITKVVINAKQWSGDTTAELGVNAQYQLLSQTAGDYIYNVDAASDLVISSRTKRVYTTSITIYYEL